MATYPLARGTADGFAAEGLDRVGVVRYRVDLGDVNNGSGTAAGDVLELIHVPAGSLVRGVWYEVVTAGPAGLTFDLGDGVQANGYLDNVAADATGSGVMELLGYVNTGDTGVAEDPVVFRRYTRGKYYAAADTIDMVVSAAATTGVIEIAVELVQAQTQGALR